MNEQHNYDITFPKIHFVFVSISLKKIKVSAMKKTKATLREEWRVYQSGMHEDVTVVDITVCLTL